MPHLRVEQVDDFVLGHACLVQDLLERLLKTRHSLGDLPPSFQLLRAVFHVDAGRDVVADGVAVTFDFQRFFRGSTRFIASSSWRRPRPEGSTERTDERPETGMFLRFFVSVSLTHGRAAAILRRSLSGHNRAKK
jgi:hypothetical protein